MASIFTYDPDPPRVSSPWTKPLGDSVAEQTSPLPTGRSGDKLGGLPFPALTTIADHDLTYLDAEPATGSVEYKLHLLLRPRQQLSFSSTGDLNTDPRALPRPSGPKPIYGVSSDTAPSGKESQPPSSVPSPQSRQNRLQHLTTQLLWRLQQSSPYHASSKTDLVIPNLPDASGGRLGAPDRPGKLLPGIEESQGAIYEIGVNDDGALIGLTREEMSESLTNLRVMAASLGCTVSVLRAVVVGRCQQAPTVVSSSSAPTHGFAGASSMQTRSVEDLLVVEALVSPDTAYHPNGQLTKSPLDSKARMQTLDNPVERAVLETEQLRVSLTGSTTSGKSSLLGTLLASTLDNARGKSRLNLLKHRHEIASGVTSSVAHELLGYGEEDGVVVNYACDNVESWTDVHNTAEGGRLVLLTDSAGHPRFRRTIVRSLIAWQPHWTLCCIAAMYSHEGVGSEQRIGDAAGDDRLNSAQTLAIAHLELCLKLELPLVVVITKYDLATRQGLKHILSRVLDTLKAAGRVPQLLKPTEAVQSDEHLQLVPRQEMHEVRTLLESVKANPAQFVPIVLTSAVTGAGVTKLHALLQKLPILATPGVEDKEAQDHDDALATAELVSRQTRSPILFDVDEIFVKRAQNKHSHGLLATSEQAFVLSGLLQRGSIRTGDELLLGPFSESSWTSEPRPPLDSRRAASYPVTEHELAMRKALRFGPRRRGSSEDVDEDHTDMKREDSEVLDSGGDPEWYNVRVVSLRNLRLPVQSSFEGQAATIGITFSAGNAPNMRPRKGMVLLRGHVGIPDESATSCHSFQAIFEFDAYKVMEPGARFFVYVASLRAQVKVATVSLVDVREDAGGFHDDGHVFHLDDNIKTGDASAVCDRGLDSKKIEVHFQLISSREYIEVGEKALIMPEQSSDGAHGLDGYVGRVNAVHA